MNFKISLKTAAFLSAILILNAGNLLAQTENASVRRNSPFAPNPKKRIETPNIALQNNEPANTVKNVETGGSVINDSETTVSQNSSPQNSQAPNYTERTIAKQTFDIAKRASAANVSPSEIYKVGAGDILFIGLQNAPAKETNYFTVLQDGKIDYPLAGEMVSVGGMTAEDIEELIKEKIKLYENPQVSVKIREYNSHAYTVLGMVEKSGEKFLQREAVPLFVVRAEAIIEPKANQVRIKRKNSDEQIVDLKDEKAGETLIFSGDIVEFGSVEEVKAAQKTAEAVDFYYVGGEIISGGQKDFHQGLTLTQAILAAGGLKNPKTKKVIIRRKNEKGMLMPLQVDLKAVKEGKVIDPAIVVGDTIEIGN